MQLLCLLCIVYLNHELRILEKITLGIVVKSSTQEIYLMNTK